MKIELREFGPPERVYVESEWYDGPRSGIADIGGVPHRFKSLFDEEDDEYFGTFVIWPIDKDSFELEIEQWNIFVSWNRLYESGEVDTESHPGNGGINQRWDELELILKQSRNEIPDHAKQARAELKNLDRDERYSPTGPDYEFRWKVQ